MRMTDLDVHVVKQLNFKEKFLIIRNMVRLAPRALPVSIVVLRLDFQLQTHICDFLFVLSVSLNLPP
jgi:hypothetical protein